MTRRQVAPLLTLLLLVNAGCVFTAEHEMLMPLDAGDDQQIDAETDADVDAEVEDIDAQDTAPDPLTVQVELFHGDDTIEDGDRLVLPIAEEVALTYVASCVPDDDCSLQCRFNDDDWKACLLEDDLIVTQEGDIRLQVRAVRDSDKEDRSEVIEIGLELLFDFELQVEGLSNELETSHGEVGFTTVSCSRESCEFECAWEKDQQLLSFDCPITDPEDIEVLTIPPDLVDALGDTVTLLIEACATDVPGDIDDHCKSFTRSFTFVAPRWRQVSTGEGFACGLLIDGSLWCWGINQFGQLGIENSSSAQLPTRVEGRYKSISSGGNHTCAVDLDDRLLCWGANHFSQLGLDNTTDKVLRPTQVLDPDMTWKRVTAGKNFTCGIDTEDRLFCWGANGFHQLGNQDASNPSATPMRVLLEDDDDSKWISASAGGNHVCAALLSGSASSDANLYCWGNNSHGEIGNNQVEGTEPLPVNIKDAFSWNQALSISTGFDFSCAVRDEGDDSGNHLYCWGNDDRGRLGHTATDTIRPTTVVHTGIKHVEAGTSHSCAISDGDELFCWGDNTHGQIGIGILGGFEATPQAVDGEYILVSTGDSFTCAINTDEELLCWGAGAEGQLASDSLADLTTPTLTIWPNGPPLP